MTIIHQLLKLPLIVILILLGIYLVLPLLLLILNGICILFRVKTPFQKRPIVTEKNFDFGIIITAHQDTKFIPPIVDSVLKQTYKEFTIYIVADDCPRQELSSFENTANIRVLHPNTPLNAKIKSIHYAIDNFKKKHDTVIILDADNLIDPEFLNVINTYLQKGYKVVQSNFRPKNTDTNYERMDAIGDLYNFFLEREVRMRLGLSAAIWGSGVAIDYDLYNEVVYSDFLGGFDKKLQAHIMQSGNKVGFAPDAILYDEKIANGKSLEKQRTRWISSYFKYFSESFNMFIGGLKKGNADLIYSGFITLRPPLIIVLLSSILATILTYFILPDYFLLWCGILLSFPISFILIVAIKGKDIRFIKTLFYLPLFAFRQTMALLKLSNAKKSFMKTEHSKVLYIHDLLNKKATR